MTFDQPPADIHERVLVLAPKGRDAALVAQALVGAGIRAAIAGDLEQLCALMAEGAGAAIVADEALKADAGRLASQVEAQPAWSDFPLIILTEGERQRSAAAWRHHHLLAKATVLPRPLTPDTLISVARAALRARHRQYQLRGYVEAERGEVLEGIYDGFLAMDLQWRCVYLNRRGEELLDRRRENLVGVDMRVAMPHWSEEGFQSRIEQVMETGTPFAVEVFCALNGRWFDVRGGLSLHGVSFFFADITARKMAEEQMRTLVAELSHRVKNTLSTVQTIATQTFGSGTPSPEMTATFMGRLMALSHAHSLLLAENWEKADLQALLDDVVAPYRSRESENIVIEGASVGLAPKATVMLGMVFHELATNAAKYGALSSPGGMVKVTWAQEVHETGGFLRIEWTERGGPPVTQPARKGFGTQLISRGVAHDLGGDAVLDFAAAGLSCVLSVPLPANGTWPASGRAASGGPQSTH